MFGSMQTQKIDYVMSAVPQKLLRFRPGIFDFDPDVALKLGHTKPKISGSVPTKRRSQRSRTILGRFRCFNDDPKLLNCEIPQPSDACKGAEVLSMIQRCPFGARCPKHPFRSQGAVDTPPSWQPCCLRVLCVCNKLHDCVRSWPLAGI